MNARVFSSGLTNWLMNISRLRAALVVSVTATALSVVVTFLITMTFGEVFPFYLWLAPATLAPMTITPPICAVFLKMAHELKSAKAELRRIAYTDELTGAFNRRRLMAYVDQGLASTYCVVLIDLDHFKSINDAYGHALGDYVLIAVADTCKQHLRSSDFFSRWGGEEFLVILPDVEVDQALVVAEKLRIEISKVTIPGTTLRISASVGVSSSSQSAGFDEVFRQADANVYVAKAAGRNRVHPQFNLRWVPKNRASAASS